MSAPQSYSLSVYRGDSYRWQFSVWADAAKTQPVDLTGVAVASEIRQAGRITPLALTVAGNVITAVLSHAASQQMAVADAKWDLQLTYPSGEVKTIVSGSVQMRADVTGSTAA